MLQKPDSYLRLIAEEQHWKLSKQYAIGMLFLSRDPHKAQLAQQIVNQELAKETLSVAGWRKVPTNPKVLGPIALDSLPDIQQVFISAPAGWRERDVERRLYIARRRIEKQITDDRDFYICSLSTQVLVYKGLCMPADLPRFYLDLADLRMESAICLFHQRFSTNTQHAGRWLSRFAIWRTMAKSTPLKVTASGHALGLISSRHRCCPICKALPLL